MTFGRGRGKWGVGKTDLMFMVVVWMEVEWRGVQMWLGEGWVVRCYVGMNSRDEGLRIWEVEAFNVLIAAVFAVWECRHQVSQPTMHVLAVAS